MTDINKLKNETDRFIEATVFHDKSENYQNADFRKAHALILKMSDFLAPKHEDGWYLAHVLSLFDGRDMGRNAVYFHDGKFYMSEEICDNTLYTIDGFEITTLARLIEAPEVGQ